MFFYLKNVKNKQTLAYVKKKQYLCTRNQKLSTMEKKIYCIPTMEITDVKGLYPMALETPSGKVNPAPKRRDPVF